MRSHFQAVNHHISIFWMLLFTLCVCFKLSCGVSIDLHGMHQLSQQGDVHIFKRQATSSTTENKPGNEAAAVFSYWYIFVLVGLFAVIVTVFVCACVMRTMKKSHHSGSISLHHKHSRNSQSCHTVHPQQNVDEQSLPQHTTGSSSVAGESPLSFSVGHTPIPSPQPSAASSQRSYRSQGGKRRRNYSSGHVSSSSDETIRVNDYHSTFSLMSHSSGQAGTHPRLLRTESTSSGDRGSHNRHSGRLNRHRRTTSNPHIQVMPSDGHPFHSAPSSSMQSMESVGSSHSGSQRTLVDVDVTVHLGADNDHESRKEIAAALAESARKLAQSAADFDQEDSYSHHSRPHHSNSQLSHRGSHHSRRQLFSTQTSSISLSHDYSNSPLTPPAVSLDRPRLLERSHTSFPTRVELVRRNSLTRGPPPESPLTISHSSQRSLSIESNPVTRLPQHMRVQRVHSLDDSEPQLSQREISLDNLHHSPSPPHPVLFTPKPILSDEQHNSFLNHLPHQTTVSLDFSHMEQMSPIPNGIHMHGGARGKSRATLRSNGTHFMVESDHGVSPDSGMGNGDYGTGTESSSSTLRSSHIEKCDRLSRLSENSMECLNSEEREGTHTGAGHRVRRNSDQGLPSSPQKTSQSSMSDVIATTYKGDRSGGTNGRRKHNRPTLDLESAGQENSSSDENSSASGYAATDSASSVESTTGLHDSHIINGDMESQFSYPLQRLLSQPLPYCDDIGTAPLSLDVHNHKLSYSNGKYQSHSQVYPTQNGYSLNSHKRTSPDRLARNRVPYHLTHSESRYQSSSIAVDV